MNNKDNWWTRLRIRILIIVLVPFIIALLLTASLLGLREDMNVTFEMLAEVWRSFKEGSF